MWGIRIFNKGAHPTYKIKMSYFTLVFFRAPKMTFEYNNFTHFLVTAK